jgi:transcriptional regulator with XRE-family HTH domain
MGLVELGRHTGLSDSFLSQLETGRVVPTLRNLARIAMVFSKDLSYFFEPEPQTLFRIHRGKDRVRLPQSGVQDPSYYFESLGYMVPDRQLDPYFAEFLPAKAGREPRAHQHFGCEFLYLLSGELNVRHGEQLHHVGPGDGIYFDASTIHSYECAGEVPATALIVTIQQPAQAGMWPARTSLGNGNAVKTRSMPAAGSGPVAKTGTNGLTKAG